MKPTDLGPIYKEPILAEVYFAVLGHPDEYHENDYLNLNTYREALVAKGEDAIYEGAIEIHGFLEHCMNRYLHDRLQQIDPEVKVETKIRLKVAYNRDLMHTRLVYNAQIEATPKY